MTWHSIIKVIGSKMVSDWRHAWRWFSVQLGALIFIAPTLYENIDVLQDILPRKPFAIMQAGLGLIVMLNAIKKKKKKK